MTNRLPILPFFGALVAVIGLVAMAAWGELRENLILTVAIALLFVANDSIGWQ